MPKGAKYCQTNSFTVNQGQKKKKVTESMLFPEALELTSIVL